MNLFFLNVGWSISVGDWHTRLWMSGEDWFP
jgi:hypothetical protein